MKKSSIKGLFFACAAVLMTSSAGAVVFSDAVAEEAGTQTQTFLSSDLIMPGAAVRIEDDGKNGIRFPVRLTPETYNKFKGEITESGTLIVPKSLYNDGELVLENVGKSGYDTDKRVTTNNWKAITEKDDEGVEHSYMQTLIYAYNIPETNLNEEFCVRGYVIIDGEVIYSSTVERSMTSVAEQALPDYVKDAEKTGLLQSYIKYDVTFDAANGTETTSQLVGYNGKATEPDAPEAPQSYAFSHWTLNGEEYDFNSVVTEDITLTAVYEQISRYEVLLGDGSGTGWGHDPAEKYACESSVTFTQFEGENVMALTLKDTDRTKTSPAYVKIDRAGSVAEAVKAASTKKYIGFKVYSPVNGVTLEVLFHNGSKVAKLKYYIKDGWNEVAIDVQKALAGTGTGITVDADTPIYRLGLGIYGDAKLYNATTTGSASEATNQEFTFYFDDVYATDYDMANIIDFESVGDINRYVHGVTSHYANIRYKFANGGGMKFACEEVDGEKAVKMTPTYLFGQLQFQSASDAFLKTNLTGYKAIEVRVRVNSADARLSVGLGKVQDLTQIVDGSTQAEEWVTYSIDLTTETALANIAAVGELTFKVSNASESPANGAVWFWIDYIKFVK